MLGNAFRTGLCCVRRFITQPNTQALFNLGLSRLTRFLPSPALNRSVTSSAAIVSGRELNSVKDFSLIDKINEEIHGPRGQASRLFAVIHAAGKQRKITTEDIIVLDKPIEATVGDRIRLNKVLLVGGKNFTVVGRPVLSASQARVEATVIEKTLSHGKIIFWYIRRKRHRVFKLKKSPLVYLRINSIELSPLSK